MPQDWTKATLAKTIDHTVLKPNATGEQIRELCHEAAVHHFASVCVNPCHVSLAVRELSGSDVSVCTVIGFPLGANATAIKAEEARLACKQGAKEIDMVMNIGWAKAGDWKAVEDDIRAVVKASDGNTVKVIIETCLLTNAEKERSCDAIRAAGAAFVKTSTGFSTDGATRDDIRLLRKCAGSDLKVKASGGIRSCRDALALLEAGADRIGSSSGVAILAELPE